MRLRPEHLVAGAEIGGAVSAVEDVGQRSDAVDLHDLDLRPRPRQPLPGQGVSGPSPGPGQLEDLVELLQEAAVAGRRGGAAFEPECRHGDLPAVVDPSDDVLPRAPSIREEDLVELLGPVDLSDRPDLYPFLPHGHEQVRDPGVLGHVRIGPCQQEDVVGVLGLRGPDLLTVDDPLVLRRAPPES